MNLYEICFEHHSQKDSKKGFLAFLAAESDEQVYEWLKSNPKLKDDNYILTGYSDEENDEKLYEIYDDNYDVIGMETFKEKIVRLKGCINDESVELVDLYYGLTLYGWNLLKEHVKEPDIDIIKNNGIGIYLIDS